MSLSVWWTLPALVGLIGLGLTLGGLGRMARLKVFSGSSRLLFGGFSLAMAGVAAMFGLNLQTYARLTDERIAAEVTLVETAPRSFTAQVRIPDDQGVYGDPVAYDLTGDAFRMEARILKWRPWANITGYDAVYRLDRLQGRFDDVAVENAAAPTAHALSDNPGFDIYELANGRAKSWNVADTLYGGGTYVPMANGAVYEVRMTQWNLIARPTNAAAEAALSAWGAPQAVSGPPADSDAGGE